MQSEFFTDRLTQILWSFHLFYWSKIVLPIKFVTKWLMTRMIHEASNLYDYRIDRLFTEGAVLSLLGCHTRHIQSIFFQASTVAKFVAEKFCFVPNQMH